MICLFDYEIVYKKSTEVYVKGIKSRNYNTEEINILWEEIEKETDFESTWYSNRSASYNQ